MFSELIDECLARVRRPEKLQDAAAYGNLTIQECSLLRYFHKDLIETSILATANPHIWTYPANLRRVLAVRYANGGGPDGTGDWPEFKKPGRAQTNALGGRFYYAAGGYFAFRGVEVGTYIDLAYYQYLPKLQYYNVGSRPAVYDRGTNTWEYHEDYDIDDDTREQARELVSNWLLFNFDNTLQEGVLAKLLKLVGDDTRAGLSFSLYTRLQQVIVSSESSETLGN